MMILLDTHIWFWWVAAPELLSKAQRELLDNFSGQVAVSIISLWEIALLESKERISLPNPIKEWFKKALDEPKIDVIDLSREIVIESNHLPGTFHRDPADRIIVATSRILNAPLVTSDSKILKYQHVEKIGL
jgi:PIN domain nuclease of toxin-antitoxin system